MHTADTYSVEKQTEKLLGSIEVESETKKAALYKTNDPTIFRPKRGLGEANGKANVRESIKGADPEKWAAFKQDLLDRGVLTPIQVMSNPNAKNDGVKYLILAGERRWTAFTELVAEGHTETMKGDPLVITYQIEKPNDDDEAFELMAIENLHRENLTPMEQAKIVKAFMDQGLATAEICQRLNQTSVWVNGLKALMKEETPEEVREALADGKINKETAINIARQVKGGKDAKLAALQDVVENAASKTEQKRQLSNHTGKGPGRPSKKTMLELYDALVETDEEEVKGTMKKEDVLKLMCVTMEWALGTKADRTMKILVNKVFDGAVDTSNLFKKSGKKKENDQ
jgi:ParB/RepB/Spo0J family partition protein